MDLADEPGFILHFKINGLNRKQIYHSRLHPGYNLFGNEHSFQHTRRETTNPGIKQPDIIAVGFIGYQPAGFVYCIQNIFNKRLYICALHIHGIEYADQCRIVIHFF
jgi:hypothetical protein